ncbi:MAG: hypothetical protein ABI600_16310 [Luteolibacter sp.]
MTSKEALDKKGAFQMATFWSDASVSMRLEVPASDESKLRDHDPSAITLVRLDLGNPDQMEEAWSDGIKDYHGIRWGWYVILGLLLAGGAIWSLGWLKKADDQAGNAVVAMGRGVDDPLKKDQEAGQLIELIHKTTRSFFEASTLDSLVRFVRQPGRVRPLMEKYYAAKPVAGQHLSSFKILQPLALDESPNFWMASVELENREVRDLIIEITPLGEVRIDWETSVCYQPMKWDDFVRTRPKGSSYDFRVYVEQDTFYSHEFADSYRWNCFKLSALDSEETLFGYAKANGEISNRILDLLNSNGARRTSMILRVTIPEGLQSKSGVVIEKLMNPRWLYIDPPASDL